MSGAERAGFAPLGLPWGKDGHFEEGKGFSSCEIRLNSDTPLLTTGQTCSSDFPGTPGSECPWLQGVQLVEGRPCWAVPETQQLGQRGSSAVAFTCHP